jgi:hypothetical protein
MGSFFYFIYLLFDAVMSADSYDRYDKDESVEINSRPQARLGPGVDFDGGCTMGNLRPFVCKQVGGTKH